MSKKQIHAEAFFDKYIRDDFEKEFDIVTEDDRGYVFYEVKFRKDPIPESAVKKEIEQVQAAGLDCYKYVFISRSGIEQSAAGNTEYISLSALYQ